MTPQAFETWKVARPPEVLGRYSEWDAKLTMEMWAQWDQSERARRDERLALVVPYLAILSLAIAAILGVWRCS